MKRWIAAALLLSACQPEPRSASYFQAHANEARRVGEACTAGTQRGAECENARSGLSAAEADMRRDLFKKSFE